MIDITHRPSSLFLTCNHIDSWMQYFIYTYKPVSKLLVTCKRVFISYIGFKKWDNFCGLHSYLLLLAMVALRYGGLEPFFAQNTYKSWRKPHQI